LKSSLSSTEKPQASGKRKGNALDGDHTGCPGRVANQRGGGNDLPNPPLPLLFLREINTPGRWDGVAPAGLPPVVVVLARLRVFCPNPPALPDGSQPCSTSARGRARRSVHGHADAAWTQTRMQSRSAPDSLKMSVV